eukprot:5174767-Pleurochrysis_carterae.AAC.6
MSVALRFRRAFETSRWSGNGPSSVSAAAVPRVPRRGVASRCASCARLHAAALDTDALALCPAAPSCCRSAPLLVGCRWLGRGPSRG